MAVTNVPVPPGWVLGTSTITEEEFQRGNAQFMREDDEETRVLRETYHQTRTPLNQLPDPSNLWQLPTPDPAMIETHKSQDIGKQFHKNCDIINRHWRVAPAEAVPEIMRPYTPYSAGLLLGLRRLASHTKQNFKGAQDALLFVWRQRLPYPTGLAFDPSGMQVLQSEVDRFIHAPQACERIIQETNYGLTLQDVASARAFVTTQSQPPGKVRGRADPASRAEKLAARKERKESTKMARKAEMETRQKDLEPVGAGAKKVKKNRERARAGKMREKLVGPKGDKLMQFLQADEDEDGGVMLDGSDPATAPPPNSPDPNGTHAAPRHDQAMRDVRGAGNRFAALTNGTDPADDPARATRRTRQDRHNDDMLSSMFNRVDMEGGRGLSSKKAKKLMAGGASRRGIGGAMPEERVRLAEIPTLYAQQGIRRAEEVMQELDKMGLGKDDVDGGDDGEPDEGGGVVLEDEEL